MGVLGSLWLLLFIDVFTLSSTNGLMPDCSNPIANAQELLQSCTKPSTYNANTKGIINSLKPRQNNRHFADDVFKYNFMNDSVWIPIKISLKFVPKGPINNIPALVQIMAWRWTGNKPLSEPMMAQSNDAYMLNWASMS